MDCEKYEKIALDLLYDELDELSAAAAKRHLDQCARCREIQLKFRTTRDLSTLSLIDPPDGFEQRVLAAERQLRRRLPIPQRVGRAISILAGYAMRPQLAMAALLLLMIGSSLIFLRARPGERSSVLVTERGMPELEGDSIILPAPKKPTDVGTAPPATDEARQNLAPLQEPSTAAAAATVAGGAPRAQPAPARAKAAEQENQPTEGAASGAADRALHDDTAFSLGRAEEKQAAGDALQHARGLQQSSGCTAAAPKFDEVSSRYPGTSAAVEATWRAAECRRLLGEYALARQGYTLLLDVDPYSERAQAALDSLETESSASAATAARKSARTQAEAPAAAAAPAKPAAAKAKSPPAAASPRQ